MFLRDQEAAANTKLGTTAPIFVPRGAGPAPVEPGDYFWIKIHSAQAAFRGSIFDHVKQLLVTSKVNLNHPVLGNEDLRAIQRSRDVKKNSAEKLGLSSNLISLVPATMTHVSLSIDFILDKENNLAKLGALVNDDTFIAAVSLAPGAVAVAKTIGGLAQKVVQTFIPAEEQQPILQFAGDFNLGMDAGESALCDGYYVILGTRDEENPLPTAAPKLEIRATDLFANGEEVTQLSYIILDVTRVPARTRKLSAGAAWESKLREAESVAQETADDPLADDEQKRNAWAKCKSVLQDAKTLLLADPNYAPAEADGIYKLVYKWCADTITAKPAAPVAKGLAFGVDRQAERSLFGEDLDADLEKTSAEYAKRAAEAERVLAANALI